MGAIASAILGAVADFAFKLISSLMAKKEEQLAGQNTQALEGAKAGLQADAAAQKVATSVDGLSHEQLVAELRRPNASGHQ